MLSSHFTSNFPVRYFIYKPEWCVICEPKHVADKNKILSVVHMLTVVVIMSVCQHSEKSHVKIYSIDGKFSTPKKPTR
jgi:hypothetical protein